MAADKLTEISFEAFCGLYMRAREQDERRLDDVPDRYPPGTGVLIPIDEGAHEHFDRLVKQGKRRT